jgi:hypothetical protein
MMFGVKPSRDEENRSRKMRLAKVRRGPGVFVYAGGAFDVAAIPTVKLAGKNEPVFDGDGLPVTDSSGRQVFQKRGTPIRDRNGVPVLGGPPKMERIELEVFAFRGIEFPRGEAVEVDDESIALKLRLFPFMGESEKGQDVAGLVSEVSESIEAPAPKKRGRPKKTEV